MRAIGTVGLGLAAVAGMLAFGRLAPGAEAQPSGARTVAAVASSKGVPTTGAPTTVAPGGDLEVVVPPVPPAAALPGLCHALVSGNPDPSAPPFRELIGVTGGTEAAARQWCAGYLAIRARR